MSVQHIDVEAALAGLKDFQRRTVDYVFRRLYLDQPGTTRFLVADEVGLGKTMVARGIIAKAVQHLQQKNVKRIDVLYICSNGSIAKQNLNRLNVTDQETADFATRLTLLPKQLKDFNSTGINFISFTPGTTFDLKGRGGRIDERALIYQMIDGRLGVRSRQLFRLLQCNALLSGWTRWARRIKHEFDEEIARKYVAVLENDADLMKRLEDVCGRFHRVKKVNWELNNARLHVVGDLRRKLADVCIDALEPDLVILDEFQRFKDLLHGDEENDAAELAQRLFKFADKHGEIVRILLLSATPYRMLSMDHEEEDDHYADFLETLRFLLDKDESRVNQITEELRRFRQALYGVEPEARQMALGARDRLEGHLKSVVCRTERIDMTRTRNAMLTEPPMKVGLTGDDLLAARFVDRVARSVDAGDAIEYWKSSPYLVNFMDRYELKEKLLDECANPSAELHAAFREADGQLLRGATIQQYHQPAVNNARLRSLMDATVNAGQWQWLWLPPALPYLAPRGVYAKSDIPATKALIFSNWQVVPDAIAALTSYEAERMMLQGVKDLPRYKLLHKKRRQLLQFRLDAEKKSPAGMPALALIYPCATLAAIADPMKLAVKYGNGSPADLDVVKAKAARRIQEKLAALPAGNVESGRVDERWYWAAPVMLDVHHAEEMLGWLEDEKEGLTTAAAVEEEAGAALKAHVELLQQAAKGELDLGKRPDDLAEVLAEMALGAPGVCAIRALQRVATDLPETSQFMLSSATRMASGLRTLFNQPEVTAMLRLGEDGEEEKTPYWQHVLRYCIEGNLQAVLDEYAHILKESEGLTQRSGHEVAAGVADAIAESLSLRTSTLRVDDFKATAGGRIRRKEFSMRCRFALRFGDVRDDDGKTLVRAGSVRRAFNSPFRPFILASTSVGQEGLDFHQYCHVVYHWNLPSNPVDLEQREGRVHRYKGHAIRRNIARAYGLTALHGRSVDDPWEIMFARAVQDREPGASELVPYWLFELEGGHAVERRVPMLPLSREVAQFRRLKRMLAIYRLAFGQPRQEDLLCYLSDSPGPAKAETAELRLRLVPERV